MFYKPITKKGDKMEGIKPRRPTLVRISRLTSRLMKYIPLIQGYIDDLLVRISRITSRLKKYIPLKYMDISMIYRRNLHIKSYIDVILANSNFCNLNN